MKLVKIVVVSLVLAIIASQAHAAPAVNPYTPDPTMDRTPTLTWNGVSGAYDYKVQIDDDSSFASPLVQVYTSGATSYTPLSNLPLGNIYWRVSSSLDYADYSNSDHFLIDPDTDADGVPDRIDGCPTDPNKIAPGYGGCGVAEAAVTPGAAVTVSTLPGVNVTLQNVSEACILSTSYASVFVPLQYRKVGYVYEIQTDCEMTLATVCLSYADSDVLENESLLELHQLNGQNWENVTTSLDMAANTICADASTFSPFVVVEPPFAPTPAPRIAAGFAHSLAIKNDGSLWAWGGNYSGQLGVGTAGWAGVPIPVYVLNEVQVVAANANHTLAMKNDGTLWAWGGNGYGQVGNGTATPTQVMTGVQAVAAGGGYTLALKTDGTLWAWGDNEYGQLGDGTTTNRSTPVQVMTGVQAVAAGGGHTLALKTDATLWAWGNNYYGQLGDGTTTNRTTPVQVMTGVQAVAAGGGHTLALKTDATLWAWGYNYYGQLGDYTIRDRRTPIQTMTGVQAVAADGSQTLALKKDGSLWAWGGIYFGSSGWGGIINYVTYPVQKMTGVQAVAAGGTHALALKADGTLWSWGDNFYGQLGYSTDSDNRIPGQSLLSVAETDTDHDGALDTSEDCPFDPLKIAAGVCGCGVVETDNDADGDGRVDCIDACPNDPGKFEAGLCGCGVIDSDTDADGDGAEDCIDACPTDPYKFEAGTCGCGVADTDSDWDGTADCNDGCPTDPDKTMADICGCGVAETDSDGDGTPDCIDFCPYNWEKTAAGICGCDFPDWDEDYDGVMDCIDNCPGWTNSDQSDIDADGEGDICDLDQDNDGAPWEDYAPNSGDGNNDGIADSEQDNVVSLLSDTGERYITVETITAGEGAALTGVSAWDSMHHSYFPPDWNHDQVYNLVGFTVLNPGNPGFSEIVRIYFHGVADLSGCVYRKFDPSTSTWYTLPGVIFGVAVIDGQPVAYADLPLTDGGSGDSDLLANGTIVDPGGPALPICTLTGDFDADNDVDINDYNTFKQNWGWSGAAGFGHAADFDNDGDVDINDYNTFKQNWGRSCQ